MIPPSYPLYQSTLVRELATGQVFTACNCQGTPEHRTLRYVERNREKFELFVPRVIGVATPQPAPQGG